MSVIEETGTQESGQSTRDGSRPSVGDATQAPAESMSGEVLAQMARAGLRLPRMPYPGQEWKPRTDPEKHLLREAYRLDRIRQLLLGEIGRLRQACRTPSKRERIAAAARSVESLRDCPLPQAQLAVVLAAAVGESTDATAQRLQLPYDTVRWQRSRAISRLQAQSMSHAVALCMAAGWVTARQVEQGVTP